LPTLSINKDLQITNYFLMKIKQGKLKKTTQKFQRVCAHVVFSYLLIVSYGCYVKNSFRHLLKMTADNHACKESVAGEFGF